MAGSNTLGATIKLEGEKEYRDAITKINSSLKVMASEMNKVTVEFSKNDKSTAALSNRSAKRKSRHAAGRLGGIKPKIW